MSLAKEILLAERSFRTNYRGADVWYEGIEVMLGGIVTSNKWYIDKVRLFLVARLTAKQKRKRGEI